MKSAASVYSVLGAPEDWLIPIAPHPPSRRDYTGHQIPFDWLRFAVRISEVSRMISC